MPDVAAPLTFTCRVVRVEAYRESSTIREDEVVWRTFAVPMLDLNSPRGEALVVGHLVVLDNGNWGQVLVEGKLSRDSPFPSVEAARRFAYRYVPGYVQAVYDEARRALNLNATLLECDFDLDAEAPDTELLIPRVARPDQPALGTD